MYKILVKVIKTVAVLLLFITYPVGASTFKVALTFDDAPTADSPIMSGKDRSIKIVAALQANKVPDALFFVKAENISSENEERLKLYAQAGYHLGNHSYTHQSANEMPVNDFLIDAYRAHLMLKKYDNFLPYFRFPYLHYGKDMAAVDSLQSGLAEMGYKDGFVTIDNFDWYINSILINATQQGKTIDYKKASKLYVQIIFDAILFFDNIAKNTKLGSPMHVLLLHENDSSALFLDSLIKHIKKHGGEIISPQEAYSDPTYAEFPETIFQKQGRIAAIAEKQGVPHEQLRNVAENAKYLDDLFKKNKVIK